MHKDTGALAAGQRGKKRAGTLCCRSSSVSVLGVCASGWWTASPGNPGRAPPKGAEGARAPLVVTRGAGHSPVERPVVWERMLPGGTVRGAGDRLD